MAYRDRQKISQMTPKGSNLASTDLIEISTIVGGSYVTRSVTGAQIGSGGGGGTVTSVGLVTDTLGTDVGVVNSPITSSGDITLSIPIASATNTGKLSNTDWTTFNSKENSLTFNSPLNRSTNTISIPAATSSVNGYLSSSDWTTFNNKLSNLTINSTAIASGTAGRVLFQNASNQLSQSANLFWDNTNNRLGINTATPTVALDVNGSIRIDNTAFTGIGLTISKTANATNRITGGPGSENITFGPTNLITLNGSISIPNTLSLGTSVTSGIGDSTGLLINNTALIQSNTTRTGITLQTKTWRNDGAGGTSTMNAVKITPTADMTLGTTMGNVLLIDPTINTTGGTHTIRGLYYNPTLTSITGVTHRAIETTTGSVIFNSTSGNVAIGGTSFGTSADKVLAQYTGTAPGSSPADAYQQYSADITAGNAAPHFRTENGNVVKLYQETTAVGSATVASLGAGSTIKTDDTFDGYTLQQVVKALRNLGILA